METITLMKRCGARNINMGFTLIELMIVVSIIGIISAFAYPAYQTQVMKTRRGDAKATLTALAQAMEESYTNTMDYTAATLGSGASDLFPAESPLDSNTKFYDLSINAGSTTARFFIIWARAKSPGPQANDDCPNLWINSIGQRGASDTDGTAISTCWN